VGTTARIIDYTQMTRPDSVVTTRGVFVKIKHSKTISVHIIQYNENVYFSESYFTRKRTQQHGFDKINHIFLVHNSKSPRTDRQK